MNYKESEENKAFDAGLRLAGIPTDPYTRDLIMKMSSAAKELKGQLSVDDITKIECECCEIHGLDYETKMPIRHDNKKMLVARITLSGNEYKTFSDWDKDIKEAHDYKTHDFAEKMIVEKELKGVIILPYYE